MVLDVAPGTEERGNLASPGDVFEVRPLTEDMAEDRPGAAPFGVQTAYHDLKQAVLVVAAIRQDATLSDAERDAKAATAWSRALLLA